MSERRKKPGVVFWLTVIVTVAIYPASFGPACWISSRLNVGASVVSAMYAPITWNFGDAFGRQPTPIIGVALCRYGDLCAAPHWFWLTSWNPVIGMTWKWTDTSYLGYGVKYPATAPEPATNSN